MSILSSRKMTPDRLNVNGKALGELIQLVTGGKVGRANGKKILDAMFDDANLNPAEYAEQNGLIVSNDTGLMEQVAKEVLAGEEKAVADFRAGKEKALAAILGKCMKQLKGNCNPQVLREFLISEIGKM